MGPRLLGATTTSRRGSDAPGARPRPLARRHPRARAGDRLHGRRVQRPRRDAAGQRAQPGLGAGLPGHARGRDARALRRAAASTRCPMPGLPAHLRGLVEALGEYQQAAADAAWSGDARDAVRALAAHPLVRSIDLAERLYGEMAAAHRAQLPRGSCPRRPTRSPQRVAAGRVEQVDRVGRHGELDRLAGREARPALDARGEARAVVVGEQRRLARPRSPRRPRPPPRRLGRGASTGKITWLSVPSRSTTSSSARRRGGRGSPSPARRARGRSGARRR